MTRKRLLASMLSMYSLAVVAIPVVVPVLIGADAGCEIYLPPWWSATGLFVFVWSWSALWQDIGAMDERWRIEQEGGEA